MTKDPKLIAAEKKAKADEVRAAEAEKRAKAAEAKIAEAALATEEAEAKVKAVEDARLKEGQELVNSAELDIQISEEARALGVKGSKVKMSSFKDKDPTKVAKEKAKQEALIQKRIKNRIAKVKALAEMEPIDRRRALLRGRFEAVKAKARGITYSNKIIEALTEEYKIIQNSPKVWIKATNNGTTPFTPGNKRKKTAKQLLDTMNLD